uniref:Uncharacterized protein n=1 Tax=Tanacetum cinerariifolium TaxID=118510 RepID=A0A6L2MXR5_TANCI|nr:hypothetical protein [Tanacetum cinerariifolium]
MEILPVPTSNKHCDRNLHTMKTNNLQVQYSLLILESNTSLWSIMMLVSSFMGMIMKNPTKLEVVGEAVKGTDDV